MKAPDFAYLKARSIDDVLAAFAEHGEDAQILAGGQSLMPSLNLRLANPGLLIDINGLDELKGIDRRGASVRIGALARHVEVARSDIIRQDLPLISEAMHHVAHPAVRSRGTFGGSIAFGDPAAELPACVVALDAGIVLRSARGTRTVTASEYYTGLYETVREPDEIVVEVLLPVAQKADLFGFRELSRRHGDFAIAGVAAKATRNGNAIDDLRCVVFGCEAYPRIVEGAAGVASGQALTDAAIERIVEAVTASLEPMPSLEGSEDYKRRAAGVLCRRLLADWRDRIA